MPGPPSNSVTPCYKISHLCMLHKEKPFRPASPRPGRALAPRCPLAYRGPDLHPDEPVENGPHLPVVQGLGDDFDAVLPDRFENRLNILFRVDEGINLSELGEKVSIRASDHCQPVSLG